MLHTDPPCIKSKLMEKTMLPFPCFGRCRHFEFSAFWLYRRQRKNKFSLFSKSNKKYDVSVKNEFTATKGHLNQ